jgi:hypothetical protein
MSEISKEMLKPCPFCGSTKLRTGGDDKIVGVWCLTCQAAGPNHYGSREWNDRVPAIGEGSRVPSPHEYAMEYEFRGDGDYTPTDAERTMIEDAICGYLGEVSALRSPPEPEDMGKYLDGCAAADQGSPQDLDELDAAAPPEPVRVVEGWGLARHINDMPEGWKKAASFATSLAPRPPAQPARRDAPEPETCERCQGNGEIVTDWERYRHPHEGDKGDEAVAECPDCNGEGTITASPPDGELVRAAREVEQWWLSEGMKKFNGAPYAIFALRAALSAKEGQKP